jgi:hypothetical protein
MTVGIAAGREHRHLAGFQRDARNGRAPVDKIDRALLVLRRHDEARPGREVGGRIERCAEHLDR